MRRYHIILADDHVMFRQGLKKLIEGNTAFRVIGEARDGKELLDLLSAIAPRMVILDISMPNLRGIEAVREIKKKYPAMKVLLLSMHKEYLHQALSAGADGYLLKEDAPRELFTAIENIQQGRIALSPRFTGMLMEDLGSSAASLSVREKEVLTLIAGGKSNKEIAEVLSISIRTVESHRASIIRKLEAKNTADLVRYAIQEGYV